MAVNLKTESLYSLQMYVQFIESLSNELVQFNEQGIKPQFNSQKISKSYFDEMQEVLKKNIDINNDLLNEIEKEIQSRIGKKFPSLISFRNLQAMGKGLDDEIKKHQELFPNKDLKDKTEKEADKKIIDFVASREKKHDKE